MSIPVDADAVETAEGIYLFSIFARAASRIWRSRGVRLWMPWAEILSRMGSTSRLMNSSGGNSSSDLPFGRDHFVTLTEAALTSSRLRWRVWNGRQLNPLCAWTPQRM